MNYTSLGYIQFPIQFGDDDANIKQVDSLLCGQKVGLENSLLVLPELWNTGFINEDLLEIAQTATAKALEYLMDKSAEYGCTFCGSMIEVVTDSRGKKCLYNSMHVVSAGQLCGTSHKQNLFTYWGEDKMFDHGKAPATIHTELGSIGGLVCYDLRFPVVSRSLCQEGADVLIYSAQWPIDRVDNWTVLLQARAIENQTFVVGANGTGNLNDMHLGGNSTVISPAGEVLLHADEQRVLQHVTIDYIDQSKLRDRFNSVGRTPFLVKEKLVLLDVTQAVITLKGRKKSGQKLIFADCTDTPLRKKELEKIRAKGDFLVLVCREVSDEKSELSYLRSVDMLVSLPYQLSLEKFKEMIEE